MNENKRKYQINIDKAKYKINAEKRSNHSFYESKYVNPLKEAVNKEILPKNSNKYQKEDNTKSINYYSNKTTINTSKTNNVIAKVEKEEPNWRKNRIRNYGYEKEKTFSKITNINNRSNIIDINRSIKEEKKEKFAVDNNKMTKTIDI